jgi:hypothetical protein
MPPTLKAVVGEKESVSQAGHTLLSTPDDDAIAGGALLQTI